MAISPTPAYATTPREDLVFDIMTILDNAVQSDEEVSTFELADQIVGTMLAAYGELKSQVPISSAGDVNSPQGIISVIASYRAKSS